MFNVFNPFAQDDMSKTCPYCNRDNCVISHDFGEEEMDNITDGQLAEAIAGNHKLGYCTKCNHIIDIGF